MTSNNKNFRKITFYFILIFFTVLILEIFLHIFYILSNKSSLFERTATPIFLKDDYCCYKNKPNLKYIHSNPEFITHIYTNKDGNRVGNQKIEFDPKKKNILILGPSFSFGQGVNYEDTYVYKLQKHFSNYNFINTSVPGHSPELNMCWLINNANNYRPDIIIQNIYDTHVLDISNIEDIKNYCKSYCKKINIEVTKSGYIKKNSSIYETIKGSLKKSALIFYSWYFYEQYIFQNKKNTNKINKTIGKEFYGNQKLDEKQLKISYKKHKEILKKINPELKIFYVLIPPSFVVSDNYSHRFNLSTEVLKIHRERYKFYANIMEKNLNVINTYSVLKENDKSKQTYYNIDVHLTKFGNKVVFELLKKYLQKKI